MKAYDILISLNYLDGIAGQKDWRLRRTVDLVRQNSVLHLIKTQKKIDQKTPLHIFNFSNC
jgi:hypothetical protein